MGTRTPNLYRVSTIFGTARAASSVLTVTRTSSEPACARAITWLTVDATSAVSVFVIDCTTIGLFPPTFTPPTLTAADFRRGAAAIFTLPRLKNLILAWMPRSSAVDNGCMHTARMDRKLLTVMAAASGISVANLYYAQPLLPVMAATWDLSVRAVASVVTLSQIGYATGMLLIVPIGDAVD